MKIEPITIHHIPALLWGASGDGVYLYIHGKSGYKEEAEAFAKIACAKGWQVLSIDLPEHGARKEEPGFTPWDVMPELTAVMAYVTARWRRISLRATSIGAWFSMLSFADVPFESCLFVSPVLDMAQLIQTMMQWAGVSEDALEREKIISTDFGETLSWQYHQFAKAHPIRHWPCPTAILYAGGDNLTSRSTVDDFVSRFHCDLTVMADGVHWFHTPEQLSVLAHWTNTRVEKVTNSG